MPGARLQRVDGGIGRQLDVDVGDLGGVGAQHDGAVHLGQLVEQLGRVVEVELDPAAEQEGELVHLADHDQPAGVRVEDVVDPLAQRRARRHHLQSSDDPGVLSRLELLFELITGTRRHEARFYPVLIKFVRRAGGCSPPSASVAPAPWRTASTPPAASGPACARQAASSAARRLGHPPGSTTVPSPNRAASASRRSPWATSRSSPVSPSSPKQATGRPRLISARRRAALATARATARSAPGSSTRTPPTTFTNTSAAPRPIPAWRPSTASTSATRLRSSPDTTRRGGTSSEADTSAWTSTSSGREPSIAHSRTLPGARVASARNRAEASSTSTRPWSRISNTPASSVEPKRFFTARTVRYVRSRSPSNWSTQSTRCSSTRGPASAPSLVTWPTSSTAILRRLARFITSPATSRTWATEPAAEDRSTEWSVCTESITQTSGRSCSSVASTVDRSVSAITGTASASPPPSRWARSLIWAADSSAETYSVRRPAAHRLASAIVVSVDLPIPGAPPMSTSEPGRGRRRAHRRARRCRSRDARA